MAKQVINVGSSANDGTGDKNRVAFQKINSNFDELYDGDGAGTLQQVTDNGNTTTNDITAAGFLSLGNANIPGINFNDAEDLDTSLGFLGADPSITTPRNWVLPDTSGTIALESGTQQYKFLLSQSGGDDPQTATSGTLTQGVTYEIVAFETGDNFIPSGAPNNDVGTKWIANGVAPTWGNGSEIGWNNGAPVVSGDVTPNGIGNIWFEFLVDGTYFLKSDALFVVGKTFLNISINLSGAYGTTDRPTAYTGTSSDSVVVIDTVADTGAGVVSTNDVLLNVLCELVTYN